jgi:DNA recombination protein RmuC
MNSGIFVGIGVGAIVLWIVREFAGYRNRMEYTHLRQRYQILEGEWASSRKEVNHLREMNMHLQTVLKDQAGAMLESRKEIESKLQGICSQTLISAQKTFLTHLQPILSQFQNSTTGQLKEQSSFLTQLVSPLEQYLHDMKGHIHTLEQTRVGAYAGLKEQISHLAEGQKVLSSETNALVNSFRSPHIRGCWGEMQLRRVVELAGMLPYCDFQEHPTLATEKRHGVRPDMIISLPGNKSIIVDAKAPMTHYLESTSAKTTTEYQAKIKEHARVLASHIKALSDKKYWSYKDQAVELTVLFLPGESFLSTALEADANLLELAAQKNIILATPILCIALLKTIAQGWRQELFSQKTHRIIAMTQDLSIRLEKFHGYLLAIGKALKSGHLAYHSALGVFQETIVPTVQQLSSIVPEEKDPVLSIKPPLSNVLDRAFQDDSAEDDSTQEYSTLAYTAPLDVPADLGSVDDAFFDPGISHIDPKHDGLVDMPQDNPQAGERAGAEERVDEGIEKRLEEGVEESYKEGPGALMDSLHHQSLVDGSGDKVSEDKMRVQKPMVQQRPPLEIPLFHALSEKDRYGIKIDPVL